MQPAPQFITILFSTRAPSAAIEAQFWHVRLVGVQTTQILGSHEKVISFREESPNGFSHVREAIAGVSSGVAEFRPLALSWICASIYAGLLCAKAEILHNLWTGNWPVVCSDPARRGSNVPASLSTGYPSKRCRISPSRSNNADFKHGTTH